jgi:acetolactate synthase-1/2/3 large subunit
MKLSDYVMAFLADQGVGEVFVLPGGGCMHLVDSLGKENRLRYVACLHEQAASIAADGYAQYRGNLGAALVTTGPGSTNAITGIAGSWIESVPTLILSGQVKTPDIKPSPDMRMLGFQEVDIISMVKPVTKYAVCVRDPSTIRYHLEKAVHVARTGRPGPIWLDIPLDIQAKEIDPASLPAFEPPEADPGDERSAGLREQVAKALDLLAKAGRPVVIAGYGIKLSGAGALFRQVAERLRLPILTTWKACDLVPDDYPLYYGRPGILAHRGANFIQQNSDLIIAIGARLDFGQIGYASETFARGAVKVVVDIDPLEVEKFRFKVDLPIVSSAATFLEELDRQSSSFKAPEWPAWHERCQAWKSSYPMVRPELIDPAGPVSAYLLVSVLSDLMTAGDMLVPGSSGACSDICLQTFRVKEGQRVLNSPGIGAMGFGVPQSLGACVSSGGRRTVCVNGDGGFQLNVQELETVHRLKLPIKYFVLNNGGYASIRATQNNYFKGRLVSTGPSSGLTLPHVTRQAEAYGIRSNTIRSNGELRELVAEALDGDGPFICEVMVDPEEQTAPKVKSMLTADGRMVSKPLEDLAPFLDREEFLSNMIVAPVPENS